MATSHFSSHGFGKHPCQISHWAFLDFYLGVIGNGEAIRAQRWRRRFGIMN